MLNIVIEDKTKELFRTTLHILFGKPTKEHLFIGIGCFIFLSPLLVILSLFNIKYTLEVVCVDDLSSIHLSRVSIYGNRMKFNYFCRCFHVYKGIQ